MRLGEALHSLHMSGLFYCRSELSEPWGLSMPPVKDCLWFHAVISGECQLRSEGLATTRLLTGDFLLIAQNREHSLQTHSTAFTPDVIEMPQELVSERYSRIRHGGGGRAATLICGLVRFDDPLAARVIALLPPVILLKPSHWAQPDWIESALRLMETETERLLPGGEAIITRLADILVIQAIRTWLADNPASPSGWLGAVRDAQIGPAIARMHRQPDCSWTVSSLADAAAMSRSAFAARFLRLVGEPPLHYLTRLRIEAATAELQEGDATLATLAARLGYQSEAAFSRAFKRLTGISPGEIRRQAHRERRF